MSYWFHGKADMKCELCQQHFTQPEARLCADCEDAILRLLRLTESRSAVHHLPNVARARAA